jgi:hypothetical protein
MEPENIRFGGGATETMVHPLVAVWMVIAIVLLLVLPRHKAITVFLLSFFTIPVGQVVMIGSLHFTVLRILIIAGLIRRATYRASSSEGKYPGGFNPVDRMVVLWSVSAAVIVCLQWMNMGMLIHQLGDFLDVLGGYLVVRFLIPDREAIRRTIRTLAIVCVIQGAFMLNEQISHVNLFGFIGGPALTIREGKIRSQGVMGCIYAGAFSGALIPLFVWLCTQRKHRALGLVGLAGATVMVFTSNSSTSVLALGGSLLGLAFWPLRKQMHLVRWGLVSTLVGLHLVMKAPVWALIARIDLTGSSSGDHRYHLVDSCIRHFSDWWLLGYKYYNLWGWEAWDTCNQFVDVALHGGLVTLVAYITIYSRSFGALGKARKETSGDRAQEWFLWSLGCTLFATVVASFGINFMLVLHMLLFLLLAFISVATFGARQVTVTRLQSTGPEVSPSASVAVETHLRPHEAS